jgi:ParB family chromosome partitioning protein
MRADSHYVDQLDFPSAGSPVQKVPISKIESHHEFSQSDLRPLIDSIRSQGVVQPLLVRRQHPLYLVVAGRKRLAAAQMLRLETVPCLVHDLTPRPRRWLLPRA